MRKHKTRVNRRLLIVIATVLVLLAMVYLMLQKPIPIYKKLISPSGSKTESIKRNTVNPGLPLRLKIPKISVDAAVEHVGVTAEGELGTPKSPNTAGWYDLGPRPGETGNAVIDGHFGWKDNIPAIFDNLHLLEPGDKVYIEDDEGRTFTFVVIRLQTYNRIEDASDVFRAVGGKAHLNLITCQGVWNKKQKSYSSRLVVFADQVPK